MPKNGPQMYNRNVLLGNNTGKVSRWSQCVGTQAAGHQESFTWDIGTSLEIGPIAQSEWEKQWGTCVV